MIYYLLFPFLLLLGLGAIFLLLYGIIEGGKTATAIGAVLLSISLIFAAVVAVGVYNRAYDVSSELTEMLQKRAERFQKEVQDARVERDGMEIYHDLFGEPCCSCVQVLNRKDAVRPEIDESIMLHFESCGKEVRRLLKDEEVKRDTLVASTDAVSSKDHKGEFSPELLGDTVLRVDMATAAKRDSRTLYLKRDSSEAVFKYLFPL